MAAPNPMVAVVGYESVCRALKRLLHSVGTSANTFSSGEAFLDRKVKKCAGYSLGGTHWRIANVVNSASVVIDAAEWAGQDSTSVI